MDTTRRRHLLWRSLLALLALLTLGVKTLLEWRQARAGMRERNWLFQAS
jgi:ABC-type sulfate transport system permease subunit